MLTWKLNEYTHTHTQNPINLNEATLPDRYLSLSHANTHTLSSSRTQSNFPNRVRSGDEPGQIQYVAGNRRQSQPQSVRQAESTTDQHTDRPSGQQAGRSNEAQAGRDRNWALQMVASMMLLANIDEWKNQSDSHTHLIWCSHVNAQLLTERRLTGRLLTETWPSASVSVLLVYVIRGGLVCVCLCVCAYPWTQRCTVKCKTFFILGLCWLQRYRFSAARMICRI